VITAPPGFRGIFRTDADARAAYSEAAGIERVIPHAVAVPADIEDVQHLARWAHDTRTPLVPRGSGSSMAGGSIGDGVIVDLSRMDAIGDVDERNRCVRVGPGAVRDEVDRAARAHGLRFPPDPSSGAFCTIGGMVANNASGAHTLRFGSTRAWVSAVDCVFDDGSRATLQRGESPPENIRAIRDLEACRHTLYDTDADSPLIHPGVLKDSSGYGIHAYVHSGDVLDLIIGSEGTLVLIVGVELMLTDVAPATSSLLGAFPSLEQAVAAATAARNAGAVACELLDRTFLDVVARGEALPHIPPGTEGVLLTEVEGADAEDAAGAAATLGDVFRTAGASAVALALTPDDETHMWHLRHAASPILATLGASLTSMQFIEDGAVPPDRLPDYVRGVRAILDAHHMPGVIFGHAGDSHVHVNPLIDVTATGWRESMHDVLSEVVELTARLGGTLDGEHGDGRLRTPLLDRVWPPRAMDAFRAVKRAFDPLGIFNPGVKVPAATVTPGGDIKYDPSIPKLPARAASALATVSANRAYDRFRLDLLDEPA
jgi:FAD/FMN-containing dehydrogenase